MATYHVTVVGAEELAGALTAFKAGPLAMPAVIAWLEAMKIHMANYPPERSGQVYQRTYQLGDDWRNTPAQVGASARGLTGRIVSPTPYAQWVQRDARQGGPAQNRAYHVGRWKSDVQQANDHADELTASIQSIYDMYFAAIP